MGNHRSLARLASIAKERRMPFRSVRNQAEKGECVNPNCVLQLNLPRERLAWEQGRERRDNRRSQARLHFSCNLSIMSERYWVTKEQE